MESWNSLNAEAAAEGQWFADMPWATRIQGYLFFTALGVFSSFMGMAALGMGYMWKYSVLSALGQVMSICSTLLLMGPRRQLESMFDPIRRTTTLAYLSTIVLTVVVAVGLKSPVLCVLCGIAQYAALIWYSLSYIPYGREMVKSALSGCTKIVINA